MGWRDLGAAFGRTGQVAIMLATAGLLAGCFQPLYGERSLTGGPGVRDALAAVDVQQIPAAANTSEAHIAVEIRNGLLFSFTGGGSPLPPTHRLKVLISGSRIATSIDRTTALPNMENYTLKATYTLTNIATNKIVVTSQVSTSVSYEALGQARFARIRGMRNAERQAAQVISDNITTRLASYFMAGT